MTTPAYPARPWLRLLLLGTASATCALSVSAASAAPTQVTLVSNYQASNVYLLDDNYAWARTYSTVTLPRSVGISPNGEFAAVGGQTPLVSGTGSKGKASVINLTTHAVTNFDYTNLGDITQLGNPVFSTDSRYVFFGQRNPLLPIKVHRIDLSTNPPTSQTAELNTVTNCGEPASAMQVVGGADRLWFGCYNSTDFVGVDNLYAPTFAPSVAQRWTLGYSNTTGVAISPDQSTAYLSTLSSGIRKVTLASGSDTQLSANNNCHTIILDRAGTYAYAPCGSPTQSVVRIPTAGGSATVNASGSPTNGLRLALSVDETYLLQPEAGPGLAGGTTMQRWNVSTLGGSGTGTPLVTTPAFDAPFGVAVGTRAAAPDAPTAVTATAGNAEAAVSWTTPASDGGSALMGYTVTAAPGGATCTATPPQTACTVTGLTNGTAYTFRVVATNAIGASAASTASAPVTPMAPSPSPTPTPAQANESSGSGASPSGGTTPARPTLAVRDVAGSNQASSVTITSRVVVNGAGSVRQVGTRATGQSARSIWRATARANATTLCTASRKTSRAGTYRMTCTLGAAARAELERRAITVKLATTFSPTGGTPITRTETVVLKRIKAAAPAVTG